MKSVSGDLKNKKGLAIRITKEGEDASILTEKKYNRKKETRDESSKGEENDIRSRNWKN